MGGCLQGKDVGHSLCLVNIGGSGGGEDAHLQLAFQGHAAVRVPVTYQLRGDKYTQGSSNMAGSRVALLGTASVTCAYLAGHIGSGTPVRCEDMELDEYMESCAGY